MTVETKRFGIDEMGEPDFLYIGYEKAASTFIQNYFNKHSDIYLDNWIANYALFPHLHNNDFYRADDIEKAKAAKILITQEERLCESILFDQVIRWRNIRWNEGEVSTLLNKVDVSPQGMARRWHNLYPRVKVLIVIRDQVAWLDSLYRYSASELPRGKRSFEDFCASPRGAVVLRAGMYDLTIQAYLDVFGARQVKVLRYEDLSLDHDKFMTELCEYVGVDWIKTANEPLNVGRSSAAAFLIAHFGFLDKIPPSVRAIGRMALAVFGKNSMFGLSRKEQRLIRSFYRLSNLRTEKILSGQAEEL